MTKQLIDGRPDVGSGHSFCLPPRLAHLGKTKGIYSVIVEGDCMEPEISDGDTAVVAPQHPENGDLAILWPKDGNPKIKRVVMMPPPEMMDLAPTSEVMSMVGIEMNNPRRQSWVAVDKLSTVHRVLAVIPKVEAAVCREVAAERMSLRDAERLAGRGRS